MRRAEIVNVKKANAKGLGWLFLYNKSAQLMKHNKRHLFLAHTSVRLVLSSNDLDWAQA